MAEEKLDLASNVLDRSFLEAVDPLKKLRTCIQCGTCSASCPTAYAMDYSPRQVWRMVNLGLRDEVLNSRTFWLCTTCKSCQVRCPRGISITDGMVALKEYSVETDVNIPEGIVRQYDKLLAGGIWAIVNLRYDAGFQHRGQTRPFIIENLKPIQQPSTDFGDLMASRAHFSRDEWLDTLLR